MASVTLRREWPDGDILTIQVKAATSYHDALRETCRTALDAYAEALGVTLQVTDE